MINYVLSVPDVPSTEADKKLEMVKEERDILKKALAVFSKRNK